MTDDSTSHVSSDNQDGLREYATLAGFFGGMMAGGALWVHGFAPPGYAGLWPVVATVCAFAGASMFWLSIGGESDV